MFGTNQQDMKPQFPGLYRGTVMDVTTFVSSGQIQVSIPSIFDPPTPDNWVAATVCHPHGHCFMPKSGDTVLIAFENGDPSSPLCLGTLYLPTPFPTEALGNPLLSGVIKTEAGHLIDFNGANGSITIKSSTPLITIELTATNIKITAPEIIIGDDLTTEIRLGGNTALPVARLGDQGIGNLGVPVSIIVPPGRKVSVA